MRRLIGGWGAALAALPALNTETLKKLTRFPGSDEPQWPHTGRPRSDGLYTWPDGSLRYRRYDPRTAKQRRDIDAERLFRRTARLTARAA